jgi:hypothetical protein
MQMKNPGPVGQGLKKLLNESWEPLSPTPPGAKEASWRSSDESVKLKAPAGSRISKRTGLVTGGLLFRNENVVSATVTHSKAATPQTSHCRPAFHWPGGMRIRVCAPNSATHFNSSARSRAVCQRSSGLLARQQTIPWFNAADVIGFTEPIGAGSSSRIVAALQGRAAVSLSPAVPLSSVLSTCLSSIESRRTKSSPCRRRMLETVPRISRNTRLRIAGPLSSSDTRGIVFSLLSLDTFRTFSSYIADKSLQDKVNNSVDNEAVCNGQIPIGTYRPRRVCRFRPPARPLLMFMEQRAYFAWIEIRARLAGSGHCRLQAE